MYKSPIEIDYGEVVFEKVGQTEENLFRCIQNISINVDKEELLKALAYDRNQYEKGYADAKAELANTEDIVHCIDCKHSHHWYRDKAICFLWHESGIDVFEDGYCNYGARRTDGMDLRS